MKTFTILKSALLTLMLLFVTIILANAQKDDCAIFENFESVTPNTAYAGGIVTMPSGSWFVLGHNQMDANDRFLGTKSIRLRANASDPAASALPIIPNTTGTSTIGANVIQMNFDKPNGVGAVSFFYGSYAAHSGGKVYVEYSTDGGSTWQSPPSNEVIAPAWGTGPMLEAEVPINVSGNVRVRIIKYKVSGSTSVNIDDLCITNYDPAGYVVAPVFSPPGGAQNSAINVTITSTTPAAVIHYTLDGTDPTETSAEYSNPIAISTQTTLKAKAWKEGMQPSAISTATYLFPISVNNLTALRAVAPPYTGAANVGTTLYKLAGEVVVTHKKADRNAKYIQDANGAMLIDDYPGNLEDAVTIGIGDKITNLVGTLTNYFGMVQFVPVTTCDVIDFYQTVPETEITLSQLNLDHNNPLQAKLIKIRNVTFTQTGSFAQATYYGLRQGSNILDSAAYTDNYVADYIGTAIPTHVVNLLGVCNYKGTAGIPTRNRIFILNNSNGGITTKINDFNVSSIRLSPNPAQNFVNIEVGSSMKLEIFNTIGTLVYTEMLTEGRNTISVSNLSKGIYLLKLTDSNSGETFTNKLVVQ